MKQDYKSRDDTRGYPKLGQNMSSKVVDKIDNKSTVDRETFCRSRSVCFQTEISGKMGVGTVPDPNCVTNCIVTVTNSFPNYYGQNIDH